MTSIVMPICMLCKHYHQPQEGDQTLMCNGYPVRIPEAILFSSVDHRQPYAGDKGIQFEPATPDGASYAANLFDDGDDT
jgi:hypothetical protein